MAGKPAGGGKEESPVQPIIVRHIKKIEGGHHGGAWKVAYADFVTAMMAFFLLLWLLNVTTDEQKSGIADYFAPTAVTLARSGSGGLLAGRSMALEGARVGDGAPIVMAEIAPPPPGQNATSTQIQEQDAQRRRAEAEQDRFDEARAALEKALESNPQVAAMKDNIRISMTPEGMRIQLVDKQGGSLFPSGSAQMPERTRALVNQIAQIIQSLPNDLSISGHTDAQPFTAGAGYSNWELSSDRANASRRALQAAGIPVDRVTQVVGKADTEPLTPADPFLPENRRIDIVLLRQSPVLPPNLR
jgi:chemotaxis protein MotB